MRVDKWLWAVRLFKTRTAAAEACRAGRVHLDGHPIKASREVRAGDRLEVRTHELRRTVRVLAPLEHRIGAPQVPQFLEDLTPASEWAALRARRAAEGPRRDPGSGRPTKRERRLLEAWLELPPPEPGEDPASR